MFHKNFVFSLKVDDKFLKENDNQVRLPFGSEYSIYLKNLDARDAVVRLEVDGKDVLDGAQIIVRGNSSMEIKGFMEKNVVGNKFKFIKRTNKIEEHRGIKPEDGLIKVQFDFERKTPPKNHYSDIYVYVPTWVYYPPFNAVTYTYYPTTSFNSSSSNSSNVPIRRQSDNVGITVSGSDVFQSFGVGYVGELENSLNTMVMELFGYEEGKGSVMYSRDKINCSTCGTKNKNTNKFCTECGARFIDIKYEGGH